jgi:hypothetical protein
MDHTKMINAFRTTSRLRALLLSFGTLLLVACATGQGSSPVGAIQSWFSRMEKGTRQPGEKLVSPADVVWKERNCARLQRPYIDIDLNEVLPSRVTAGEEFNHRMIYSMCPIRTAEGLDSQYAADHFNRHRHQHQRESHQSCVPDIATTKRSSATTKRSPATR